MQAPAHARSIEAIAARLVATREALGLNQRQLCERADLAPNTYNQWERARGRPDLDGALALCEAFGLSLDWIYRGDESRLSHELAVKIRARTAVPPAPRRAKGGRP